jgi:hypothetical protein
MPVLGGMEAQLIRLSMSNAAFDAAASQDD